MSFHKLIPLLFEICDMKLLYLQMVIILSIHANRSSNSFIHQIMNAYEQQYGFPEWKQELQNYKSEHKKLSQRGIISVHLLQLLC